MLAQARAGRGGADDGPDPSATYVSTLALVERAAEHLPLVCLVDSVLARRRVVALAALHRTAPGVLRIALL